MQSHATYAAAVLSVLTLSGCLTNSESPPSSRDNNSRRYFEGTGWSQSNPFHNIEEKYTYKGKPYALLCNASVGVRPRKPLPSISAVVQLADGYLPRELFHSQPQVIELAAVFATHRRWNEVMPRYVEYLEGLDNQGLEGVLKKLEHLQGREKECFEDGRANSEAKINWLQREMAAGRNNTLEGPSGKVSYAEGIQKARKAIEINDWLSDIIYKYYQATYNSVRIVHEQDKVKQKLR